MKKLLIALSAFAFLTVLFGQQFASAQVVIGPPVAQHPDEPDPEEIFNRCLRKLRRTVERCENRNADTAHECIRRIHALLDEGRFEEARIVANRCKHKIAEDTDQCVRVIHHLCRRCINALLDLDEPELARRLREACERAVAAVRQSEERACNAIEEAFHA